MPNDVLRRAMAERKMRPVDLATVALVDPKTVEAWLRDESRIPHRDARAAVAKALEESEMALWPQTVRAAVKLGPDREIVSVYPTRSAMPTSVWKRMIGDATSEIALCGYTSYFLWLQVPDLSATLRAKAKAGCRIRVVIGDPDSALTVRSEQTESTPLSTSLRIGHARNELEPLADVVEVRQSDLGLGRSVWRGDAQAMASWNVCGALGHESPVFHLHRRQEGGLFDQVAVRHVEALWQAATPVWSP
jgi:hypothetical protein